MKVAFGIAPLFLAFIFTGSGIEQAAMTGSQSCAAAEIQIGSTPSPVLRADPDADPHLKTALAEDLQQSCAQFSSSQSMSAVRITITGNAIVIKGTLASEADESLLLSIVEHRSDGRTIFNRLTIATH